MTNSFPSSRGTLIAIGAASRINFLYRLVADSKPPFGHVVLLEPNPAAIPLVKAQFPESTNTQIFPALIGDKDGQAELLQYNFPGLASLHPPGDALRDLFPGLRIKARQQIQVLSTDTLMKRLGNAPRPLNLFIDAPGSELDILQALQAVGALDETQDLRIWCSTEPMFDNPSALSSIRSWLEARCFKFNGAEESDPDWQEIRFTLDQAALELDLARTELETLRDGLAMQHKTTQALEEQLASLQSDLALALRMQAIAQADLEDLRSKYRESQDIRASQENLLRQLTPRLHQAAQQLRAIAPDLVEPTPERLSKTPVKPTRKPAAKSNKASGTKPKKRANDG